MVIAFTLALFRATVFYDLETWLGVFHRLINLGVTVKLGGKESHHIYSLNN